MPRAVLGEELQLRDLPGEAAVIGFHASTLSDGHTLLTGEEMTWGWDQVFASARRLTEAAHASRRLRG
jgi:hypothetical protein